MTDFLIRLNDDAGEYILYDCLLVEQCIKYKSYTLLDIYTYKFKNNINSLVSIETLESYEPIN